MKITFVFYIINLNIVYVFYLFFIAKFKKITSRVIGATSFFSNFISVVGYLQNGGIYTLAR